MARSRSSSTAVPSSGADPDGQVGAKVWGPVWGIPRCAQGSAEEIIGVMTSPAHRRGRLACRET
jgi:hypothetical protein